MKTDLYPQEPRPSVAVSDGELEGVDLLYEEPAGPLTARYVQQPHAEQLVQVQSRPVEGEGGVGVGCEIRLLCPGVLEGGGESQLGELDLVPGLVVELEPGREGDDGGDVVSAPSLPHRLCKLSMTFSGRGEG